MIENNEMDKTNGNGCHRDEEHDEFQYLKSIERIIKKGTKRSDRTGEFSFLLHFTNFS